MKHTSAWRTVAAALTVLAAAGCGSTLASSDTGTNSLLGPAGSSSAASTTSGGGGLNSVGGSTAGSTATNIGSSGATTTTGDAGANSTATGTTGTSGTSTATTASSGTTAGTSGGGPASTTSTGTGTLTVGVFYVNGGNAVLSEAFAGSSVAFGNGKAEATAVIDSVNKQGGINGRMLKPVFIAIQATNASNTALQQACEGAIDDSHPAVILSMFNVSEGLADCAQENHTLLIDVALGAGDNYIYQSASNYLFTPTQISRNAEQTLVLGLAHADGQLTSKNVVGILSEDDDPMYTRVVTQTIEPLLSSWGIHYDWQQLSSGDDTGGLSSAVLKFKTSNVTYVTFSLGSGGIPEVLFMDDANDEAFRPHYLMGDSTDTSFVGQEAPKAEAENISGAGTMPLANVADSQDPTSPAEQSCITVDNNAFSAGYKNRGTSLTATLYCDLIYSYVDVARTVIGPLTDASWVAAYRSFGTAYHPVTTFATHFTSTDNYGASDYRALAWSGNCSCVTYTSGITPIP